MTVDSGGVARFYLTKLELEKRGHDQLLQITCGTYTNPQSSFQSISDNRPRYNKYNNIMRPYLECPKEINNEH